MDNGVAAVKHDAKTASIITIKGILGLLIQSINENDDKRIISLGLDDPSVYTCLHTSNAAEQAIVDSLRSREFNGYAPTAGLLQTRRAIAYLSGDLPYQLSSDDVFITSGCTQAIDVSVSMLARPGANILLPRPGFPLYEVSIAFRQVEVRQYDLLPERGWEVNLDAIEDLADQNTVALVFINPETYTLTIIWRRLGIVAIADEVHGHLAFEANPFVPMVVFGSIAPVLTLGLLSRRWMIPGWKLGWLVTNDPCGSFRKPKVVECMNKYFDFLGGPATFIQAAVPSILEQTDEVFFKKTINILRDTSNICCKEIKDIPCISCPHKPQRVHGYDGTVKLNLSLLEDISDDIDFCLKLAKEESVIILPGTAVGLNDWLRITFAVDPSAIEEAMKRIKSFYERHAKKW